MNTVSAALWAPIEMSRRLESKPTWKPAFFIVVIGSVLLTWLKSCLRGSSFVIDISVIFGSFVSISLILGLVWTAISLLLYYLSILFNAQKKLTFRIIFSLVSHCGIIFLVGEWINFVLIQTGILKSTSLVIPNRFPMGLDILLLGKSPNISLAVTFQSINLFTIWYFAVIGLGISIIGEIAKPKGVLLVTIVWGSVLAMALMLISVIGGTSIGINIR